MSAHTLVAIGVLFVNAAAQPITALDQAFAAAMHAAAPEWQADVVPLSLRREHIQRWRRGDEVLWVRHFLRESSEAAQILLRERIAAIPVASSPIPGIGDEAYEATGDRPTDDTHIHFRVGRLVIEVSAIGNENARRFAMIFLAEARKAVPSGLHNQ